MARAKGLVAAALVVVGLSGLCLSSAGLWDQSHQVRLPATPEATIHRAIASTSTKRARDTAAKQPVGQPVGLALPRLGETAQVVSVAPQEGSLEPPASPSILAWSSASSPAGATSGTTLIMGHVNWAGQTGTFSALADLVVGDRVKVEVGTVWLDYRVVASGEYLKGALPSSVFASSGSPALALVTCGGAFDSTTGHYADNVVVMAVPIPAATR